MVGTHRTSRTSRTRFGYLSDLSHYPYISPRWPTPHLDKCGGGSSVGRFPFSRTQAVNAADAASEASTVRHPWSCFVRNQ